MTPAPPLHRTIPEDRVFWAVLEAPGVRAGSIPPGLWTEIEEVVPVDPTQLWAVGAPAPCSAPGSRSSPSPRYIVCAVRASDMGRLAPGALSLTPECIPAFIPSPPPPGAFNLLVGRFEPPSIRRLRLRRHLVVAACTLLTAFLTAIGLLRRANAWNTEATRARLAAREILTHMTPGPTTWTAEDLAMELAQRRQTPDASLSSPDDAGMALAALLSRWPTHTSAKPLSISAAGTVVSVALTVPGDAQPFLDAFAPPRGWILEEPRLAAADKSTRLNLDLRRVQAPALNAVEAAGVADERGAGRR